MASCIELSGLEKLAGLVSQMLLVLHYLGVEQGGAMTKQRETAMAAALLGTRRLHAASEDAEEGARQPDVATLVALALEDQREARLAELQPLASAGM